MVSVALLYLFAHVSCCRFSLSRFNRLNIYIPKTFVISLVTIWEHERGEMWFFHGDNFYALMKIIVAEAKNKHFLRDIYFVWGIICDLLISIFLLVPRRSLPSTAAPTVAIDINDCGTMELILLTKMSPSAPPAAPPHNHCLNFSCNFPSNRFSRVVLLIRLLRIASSNQCNFNFPGPCASSPKFPSLKLAESFTRRFQIAAKSESSLSISIWLFIACIILHISRLRIFRAFQRTSTHCECSNQFICGDSFDSMLSNRMNLLLFMQATGWKHSEARECCHFSFQLKPL